MMSFSSASIEKNLFILKRRYDSAMASHRIDGSLEAALYSKFALLEFCGWIEETIDAILLGYIDRTIPNITIRETISKDIVCRVYGFKYKEEFRPLMERIIGAQNFQHIISQLSKRRCRDVMLKTMFADLIVARNRAAHTHWNPGITPQFDAPSKIIDSYNQLKPILRSIERMVNNIN